MTKSTTTYVQLGMKNTRILQAISLNKPRKTRGTMMQFTLPQMQWYVFLETKTKVNALPQESGPVTNTCSKNIKSTGSTKGAKDDGVGVGGV
jgi:hypothetical protein